MTATMSDFPGLRFSVAGNELMAVVEATAERPLLDVALAREAIDSAGYGAWFLIDEALGLLVEHYVTPGSVFALTVGERRDGRFTLEIAADAMQASIDVLPAYGGQPVMPDDISVQHNVDIDGPWPIWVYAGPGAPKSFLNRTEHFPLQRFRWRCSRGQACAVQKGRIVRAVQGRSPVEH